MRALAGIPPIDVPEVVLFAFDDCSFPFTRDLHMNLVPARKFPAEVDHGANIVLDERQPKGPVLAQGPPGALDSTEVICPNVFFVGGEYRMWYVGADDTGRRRAGLYAVSDDGFEWEKPNLGLVEVNGSRQNNLVEGPCGEWVLHDPDAPDVSRRFKSLYMIEEMRIAVSYSADGLHWRPGPQDIFGIGCEVGHVLKYAGCYHANGQGGPSPINRPIPPTLEQAPKRVAVTYASYDFEHWTHAAALSFRRDSVPPRPMTDLQPHGGEQVHEGAALWDRGNVIVGLYGQYHNQTNDRRDAVVDLGFVISHDALHWREPVPDFRMVHSYEEPDWAAPRLIQRNAWVTIGDRTVYYYSVWRREGGGDPTGVRVATWVRDRFGHLSAARPSRGFGAAYEPHCVSCPIELDRQGARIFVNADGLGQHSEIAVEILDLQFRPLPGHSEDDCIALRGSGLRQPVAWRGGDALPKLDHPIRVRVNWGGIRPEDARVYSVHVA